MILDFIDQPIAYQRLLRMLNITEFGTPARRIMNLTEIGMQIAYTQGSLTELESLIKQGQPCIIFVRTGELPYWSFSTDHAVVVGFDEKSVYVNDPYFEEAPLSISRGNFHLAWMAFGHRYATISPE